jgi:uncharacterized membrane protein YgcG
MRLFFVHLFVSLFLFAESIERFESDVTVNRDGTLRIVETITYDFGATPRHGIYRDIPTQAHFNEIIKDIGVHDIHVHSDDAAYTPFEIRHMHVPRYGALTRVKIGDPYETLRNEHTYRIEYGVRLGVLPATDDENDDAIRWNVNGTDWNVPIKRLVARFHLPDVLSSENVRIRTFSGTYGSINTRARTHWRDPHTLEVELDDVAPHENLTVEIAFAPMSLEQTGKLNFIKSTKERLFDEWYWLALVGYVIFFYRAYERGIGMRDERAVAVQYEPPKGLSLLQSGLLLDRFADDKDFAAAILELATKGYYTLEETPFKLPYLYRTKKEEKNLTRDQTYLLHRMLFEGGKRVFAFRKNDPSLAAFLRSHLNILNKHLYEWAVSRGYMQENPQHARTRFLLKSVVLLLPMLAYTLYLLFSRYGIEVLFDLVLAVGFVTAGVLALRSKKLTALPHTVFIFFGLFLLYTLVSDIAWRYALPLYITLALIAATVFIYYRTGPYTLKGARIRKHLLGLERFIKRVKSDEIRRRLEEDPRFLDKLLPYAALFGQTDHWLEFYTQHMMEIPQWYEGDIHWLYGFTDAIGEALHAGEHASDFSRFDGSGSFSGGGMGGGGGGSW